LAFNNIHLLLLYLEDLRFKFFIPFFALFRTDLGNDGLKLTTKSGSLMGFLFIGAWLRLSTTKGEPSYCGTPFFVPVYLYVDLFAIFLKCKRLKKGRPELA
tara:strand:+ start:7820 stop:8122 length:303 start_codon:yes stop_codon:yes gene_type:complete